MDILIIVGILAIPLLAHFYITSNYNRFKKIELDNKMSGFEVARKILDENDLKDIHIVETKGNLTDHYDPSRKVIKLSTDIFHGETISAAAIAAHEVGHAIQDKKGYLYMKIRSVIFPVVKIATQFSYIVILIGFLTELTQWFYLGIALVAIGLLFQIITLPVEFNASNIAKNELKKLKLVNDKELAGAGNVLSAAAMTYVAGVLASALELLRLVMLFRGRD